MKRSCSHPFQFCFHLLIYLLPFLLHKCVMRRGSDTIKVIFSVENIHLLYIHLDTPMEMKPRALCSYLDISSTCNLVNVKSSAVCD